MSKSYIFIIEHFYQGSDFFSLLDKFSIDDLGGIFELSERNIDRPNFLIPFLLGSSTNKFPSFKLLYLVNNFSFVSPNFFLQNIELLLLTRISINTEHEDAPNFLLQIEHLSEYRFIVSFQA